MSDFELRRLVVELFDEQRAILARWAVNEENRHTQILVENETDIDSVEFALTSKGLQSSNDPWIAMRRANRVAVWAAVCTASRRGRFAELLNAEDDAEREFDRKARATIDLLRSAFQTAGRNVMPGWLIAICNQTADKDVKKALSAAIIDLYGGKNNDL